MKINGAEFKEIQTEYDYFNFKINDRKIKLVYRIRQYKLISNERVLKNLRNKKVPLKHYRRLIGEGEAAVAYYRPYTTKLIPLEVREKIISNMLGIEVMQDKSFIQHILEKWDANGAIKKTTDVLMDREAISLDVLASYYMGAYEEGTLIHGRDRYHDIEVVSLDKLIDEENSEDGIEKYRREIGKMSRSEHQKVMKDKQAKSKTDRLFALYSYNDHKDEYVYWDWINNRYSGVDLDYHFKFDRLINPEKPYKSEWCLVNTDNEFAFNGVTYRISDEVEQYKVYEDNQCDMERILVMEQDNIYFFDEDIFPIDEKLIEKI